MFEPRSKCLAEGLPEDLAELPPGPYLAAVLAGIDRSRLAGYDLVLLTQARARQVAHDQAQLLADMVEVAHCPPLERQLPPTARVAVVGEFAAAEIAAALCWTRRAADTFLGLGMTLLEHLPAVHAALAAGRIDLPRARVICDGVAVLDLAAARAVVDQIIAHAPHLTTGQLRVRLARLVVAVDPAAARKRQQRSEADRRVECHRTDAGTADLFGLNLPPQRAVAAADHVDTLARALKQAGGEQRTLDQLRADVFLDLLEGRHPERSDTPSDPGRRGGVELIVPLATLAGLADEPGEVAGFGPVLGEVARRIAEDQTAAPWRFTAVGDAGEVVSCGPVRRRPSRRDAAFVRSRDRICRGVRCRTPARGCDLDHIRAYAAGGPPVPDNLAALCRHHHRLKHDGGWHYRRAGSGRYQWTSPLGHRYLVDPAM